MLTDCYLPRLGGIEVQVADLSARLVARGHEVEVFTLTPGAVRYGQVEALDGPLDLAALGAFTEDLQPHPGAGRGRAHLGHRLDELDGALACLQTHRRHEAHDAVAEQRTATRRTPGVDVNPVGQHMNRWSVDDPTQRCRGDVGDCIHRHPGVRPPPDNARCSHGRLGLVQHAMPGHRRRQVHPGRDHPAVGREGADDTHMDVRDVEALELGPQAPGGQRVDEQLPGQPHAEAVHPDPVERLGAQEWVTLPGRVPRDTLKERYAASDVFVSPSVLESFGIAALEARVAGLPIVGRVGSGISEFVTDDVNGFLADDDDELVRRLTTLAVHPSVRARMTAYNLRTEPAQGWANVVQTAEAEYARALTLAR